MSEDDDNIRDGIVLLFVFIVFLIIIIVAVVGVKELATWYREMIAGPVLLNTQY